MIETSSDMGTMLEALKSCPGDPTAWMAFADSLEEIGMTAEAEVVRLRTLLQDPECADRTAREDRLRHLLYVDKIDPPVVEHTNSIGMRFVLIPSGTFWMGSPEQEEDRHNDEGPRHRVTLTKPFWMGMHQVTRQQWETVMGNDPSGFQNGSKDCPVEQVRWNEAYEFCRKLSELPEEMATNSIYRLPTEAEWEYACRGGTTTVFHYGNSISSHMANFDGNYPYGDGEKGPYLRRTTPVGSYLPNSWKLYDMHGNVWEWCADGYDSTWYANSPEFDPVCANPYPNGVPWGNRAKKKEVEAEKPGSFQESPNILKGEGDQEQHLDQQRPALPLGVPQQGRADEPVLRPGLSSSEGGEVLTGNTFQGDPGRQLDQLRPELSVSDTQQSRVEVPVQQRGIPTSEGGDLVGEFFRPGDQRRQLVRLRPVLPVGVPLQERADEPELRPGLPDTEGGGPVGESFLSGLSSDPSNEAGRQLEQQRHSMSDGYPQQLHETAAEPRSGIQNTEGGGPVGESFREDQPERQLVQRQQVLPVGEPLRVRTDAPVHVPGLSNTEGGEVLNDDTFQSSVSGRLLVRQRPELSVGEPLRGQADGPVRQSELPTSEEGEPVGESLRSSDPSGVTRRLLVQPQPRLPGGTPQQGRDDDQVTFYGTTTSEGGEVLIDNTFRADDTRRQLVQLQTVLPVGIPLLVRADGQVQRSELPNSEGGEVLSNDTFQSSDQSNQGRRLGRLQPELSISVPLRVRTDGMVRRPEFSSSEGDASVEASFQSSNQRRRLEQFQPVFPVSIPIQDQSDVSGLRCGLPTSEGGEVLIDDTFRSVEATNNQGRQLELQRSILPVGEPLQVRDDGPERLPGLPNSNGGEVLTDYSFRSVNQGRQLELQRPELSISGSRQVQTVGLEHHPEPSDSEGGEIVEDAFPANDPERQFGLWWSVLSVGEAQQTRIDQSGQSSWLPASERGNDPVENPFRRNKLPRRVRGSGWHNFGTICRAAHHDWYSPMIRSSDSGFRILKEVNL